jgi:hypothetical protein
MSRRVGGTAVAMPRPHKFVIEGSRAELLSWQQRCGGQISVFSQNEKIEI